MDGVAVATEELVVLETVEDRDPRLADVLVEDEDALDELEATAFFP